MTSTAKNNDDADESSPGSSDVVIIDWKDLVVADGDDDAAPSPSSLILRSLEMAMGSKDSAGIVAIRNVPGFVEAKEELFPMAHDLIRLPEDYLNGDLSDPSTLYNAGWSHGKERLGRNRGPDFAKGSFYYNPVTDLPGTREDRRNYPLSYPANVWPDEDKLPHFRDRAKKLGNILTQVVVALSRHIDELARTKRPHYPPNFLYQTLRGTDKVKARLLYYFPLKKRPTTTQQHVGGEDAGVVEDSWIGWHNDSGFLTALAGDMYVSHGAGTIVKDVPDPAAGLYVVDRDNRTRRVAIPADCCAVQVGECTQIVTGGAVAATPHCVRGVVAGGGGGNDNNNDDVARISLACFVDTPPGFRLSMPKGCSRDDVLQASGCSDRVPPLADRWRSGTRENTHDNTEEIENNDQDGGIGDQQLDDDNMTFGDFLQKTFSMYYEWSS